MEPSTGCDDSSGTYTGLWAGGSRDREILEYGLADLGRAGAVVARTVKGTDAEIVGLACSEIRGSVAGGGP